MGVGSGILIVSLGSGGGHGDHGNIVPFEASKSYQKRD